VSDRAHEIDPNPYAASAVAEPYDRREYDGELPTEVGLWRDGNLVVMHVAAAWPASCVKTGQPAVGWQPIRIMRLVPGSSWRHEPIEIPVPLSARWHWLVTRLRWPLYAVGFLLIPVTMLLLVSHPGEYGAGLLLIAMIVSAFALILGGLLGETLVFAGNRSNYVWLAGAREPFLAQLPPWPFG
jgi:hypothetical protein